MRLAFYWRILALLALGALLGFVILLLKLALSNVILLIAAALSLAILLFGGWLIFTGEGSRRRQGWWLLLLSAVLVVVELAYLFINREHRGLLLITLLLLGFYLWLVRILREAYWHARREYALRTMKNTQFTHPVLIINPKSGNGRAIKAGVDKLARARSINVIITKKGDNITTLAEQAVKAGADVLGVSGGDGTLGAVAKVALAHRLPMVVLPGGTRCHFARDLGLDPRRITDALASFQGVERRVSVGLINDRVFLNNASFGIYADIVDHPEYRDNKVAVTRQVLRGLLNQPQAGYPLQFQDNHNQKQTHAVQILVGVNPYTTMRLLELGHRDQLDTGRLQITVVQSLDDATLRQLMGTMTFKKYLQTNWPAGVNQWTAQTFTLSGPRAKLVAGVDGEREVFQSPVKLRIAPAQLRLMVPPEGARTQPKSPLSQIVWRTLWHAVIGLE